MLIHELNHVFSDAKYPGDDALAEREPSEWDATIRRLRGKSWNGVTLEDFESQGGIIEGVQALSLKAFIYFLPGLVRIALIRPDSRYTVVSALLPQFTSPDYSNDSAEMQNRILSVLSPARRNFLISFFQEMQKADPNLCYPVIDSAVANLKAGAIDPYKQEEVRRWASSKTQAVS